MKTIKTILVVTLFSAFLFTSCEANEDFYEDETVENIDVNAFDGGEAEESDEEEVRTNP